MHVSGTAQHPIERHIGCMPLKDVLEGHGPAAIVRPNEIPVHNTREQFRLAFLALDNGRRGEC